MRLFDSAVVMPATEGPFTRNEMRCVSFACSPISSLIGESGWLNLSRVKVKDAAQSHRRGFDNLPISGLSTSPSAL